MNLDSLRRKHRRFIYKGFNITQSGEDLKVTFDFILDPEIRFQPTVIFPKTENVGIENLVFNLGMVELISYWKAACSPEIIIKAGYLSDEQMKFWKNLLLKGLGEFFYTNKIDFTPPDFVQFNVQSHLGGGSGRTPRKLRDRDLVLVGGGKDSAVTLDNISKSGKEFNCLMVNPTKAALNIAKVAGCSFPIIVKRSIDPRLLERNKKGYLNGHTPFSAYLAFVSTMASHLYNYKNIIVSNEASSNEANLKWMGSEINHQYSKTSEFEKDFRKYSKKYLSVSSNYFSYLRRLGEIQIAKTFAKMPKYFSVFRSCNKGSKTNSWCGRCAKCLSTYLVLYPFLGEEIKKIFGKDLFEDKTLTNVMKELLGKDENVKPFDCVLSIEETKTAISLGIDRAKKDGQKIPNLLGAFSR